MKYFVGRPIRFFHSLSFVILTDNIIPFYCSILFLYLKANSPKFFWKCEFFHRICWWWIDFACVIARHGPRSRRVLLLGCRALDGWRNVGRKKSHGRCHPQLPSWHFRYNQTSSKCDARLALLILELLLAHWLTGRWL